MSGLTTFVSTMPRPLTPYERRMYDASRRLVRSRMRDGHGRWPRISAEEVHRALLGAGHGYSLSAVRKCLSGELVSRPLLRLVSGTVRALRERRREAVPEWL